MILTVSGAQGQGKSTVLNALQEKGYNVIPNKTARSVLEDWNTTLSKVYSNRDTMVKFQEEILSRHLNLCKQYQQSNEIYFIERSFADIFAYTVCVIGPFNGYSEWLDSFYQRCKAAQSVFGGAFYISGRKYVPEDDGVRSVNVHFSEVVDTAIKKNLNDFSGSSTAHYVFEVSSPETVERVAIIEDILNYHYKD